MKAVTRLHRKYYHATAKTMKHILSLVGAPESLMSIADEVVKNCRVCRTWERPREKPMAKSSLSLQVNDALYVDILVYHMLTRPDDPPINILHMLDDASRFRMLEILANRQFPALHDGLARWFGILGPPVEIRSDQESAMAAPEMKVHVEGKSCRLNLHPSTRGGTSGSHTAASTIEGHNRIVRAGLHRSETAAKEFSLEMSPLEHVQEVQWCTNATPAWQGCSASQGALGHTPRDPLTTQEITATMATCPKKRYLDRMRLRCCCLSTIQQEIVTLAGWFFRY